MTRKQLAHSVRDRETAQAEVDEHVSGRSKLQRELRQALTPDKHKPKQVKDPPSRPPKVKAKSEPER